MPNIIILAPAWCDEHLAECWHGYNENTGISYHLGDPDSIFPATTKELGAEIAQLEKQGYQASHRSGQYVMTQYNNRLTKLPLDWQMAIEERESEQIDKDQDW